MCVLLISEHMTWKKLHRLLFIFSLDINAICKPSKMVYQRMFLMKCCTLAFKGKGYPYKLGGQNYVLKVVWNSDRVTLPNFSQMHAHRART